MKKHTFSSKQYKVASIFSGKLFYDIYKDAEFLRHSENVETILSKGFELRNMLKEVNPGERVALGGMMLARKIMRKFEFSSKEVDIDSLFNGQEFYNLYKDAEFLRHSENVETLLSKSYELKNMLKEVNPGERVSLGGMMLERNTPLCIRKTGPNVYIEEYEFTHNRLSGLVAAFAFDNRQRFPILSSSQAQLLGLSWNNQNDNKCQLFLSAVSGTEHFYDQFKYWPLVCALRKLQLHKISKEQVIKMAKIKNEHGITMAQDMMNNFEVVKNLWKEFPGSSCKDLVKQLDICPPELRMLFKNNH